MFRISMPSQVGTMLVSRRKSMGLSQTVVASRLGISQNRLSELEKNPAHLTLDRLLALTAILGLDMVLQEKGKPSTAGGEW
ncbi:MAG: transcriptional regulator [Bordetella sp. SCN 67-23]|nr:helix-turn-helix transcriptional regulator [Burkholderiales bacterium]ODS74841.1 MAG: transcriptional regulator [Bordetella sp. SCN 67-23]ODU69700.1 MAG: transcriptional regulator [Bordetella sp. SCN 68-11]OJW86475.1 MAG: transcriptional regulator [Burkholderiales bacterium 67-32]